MIKYIVIIAAGFGAYKYFTSQSGFDISSNEYNFQATFSSQPKKKMNTVSVPKWGNFKVVTYGVRDNNLACAIVVSDYSRANKNMPMGSLDNEIPSLEKKLLKQFGGKIENSNAVFSGDVKGYEINLTARDKKLVKARAFEYRDNFYNLSCYYKNTDMHSANVDYFMQSFRFL